MLISEALLENYGEAIHDDVTKRLQESQNRTNNDVNALATDFKTRLDLLRQAKKPVLLPINEEQLRVVIEEQSPTKHSSPQYQVVNLDDRVREFEAFVADKQKIISSLIKEWDNIQLRLISLAVEILGLDVVRLGARTPDAIEDALEKASEKRFNNQQQHSKEIDKLLGLEDKIRNITADTKRTAAQQQKVRQTRSDRVF
jgi:hypothetical protein